jgi:hypothetical protein
MYTRLNDETHSTGCVEEGRQEAGRLVWIVLLPGGKAFSNGSPDSRSESRFLCGELVGEMKMFSIFELFTKKASKKPDPGSG